MNDKKYLEKSVALAKEALEQGNYPIGAVLVDKNEEFVVEAHNESMTSFDMTAHAEILCIGRMGKLLEGNIKDKEFVLYTSLEPCFGCSFFVTTVNIKKVICALKDPFKGGIEAVRSVEYLNQKYEKMEIVYDPYEETKDESNRLMREFHLQRGNQDKADYYK